MARLDIKIKLPTDAEISRMFDAVPMLERYSVGDKVVRAGARRITTRARQLIPRSKKSDTDKRSKKQRAQADWETPLWKTVKLVVGKGNKGGAVAVTGPEYTGKTGAGQKIYLIAEHKQKGRRMFFWGKDGGRTKVKIRNVMVQAADEAKPQSLSAMKSKLKQVMDEVWKRG